MPPITSTNDTDGPPNPPRLCHMVLIPDFKGYGFNLHTTKERPGQYIGQVDDNSPADYAKLKKKDRIVEVNGVNISNENHKQVVARIKAVDNETRLLVVDDSCDSWYKSNNIVITSKMSDVLHCSSVRRRDSDASLDLAAVPSEDRRSVASVGSGSSAANSEASRQKEKEDSDAESDSPKKSDSESDTEEVATEVQETVELRKQSLASSTKSFDEKEESDNEKDASDDEKDASDDEKDASDDEKVASDDEKVSSVDEKDTSDDEKDASDEEKDASEDEKEDSVKERDASSDEEDTKSEIIEAAKITEIVVEADRNSTTDSERSGSIHLASEQADKNDVKHVTEVDSGNFVERKESISSASSRGSGANTGSTERAAEDKTPSSVSPSPPSSFGSPSPTPQQAPPPKSFNIPGLNMNMSVAEMRAHLASKKKKDIRNEGIDMRKKYDMIQKL